MPERIIEASRAAGAAPTHTLDDFQIGDIVDVTDHGRTFRGIVAKLDRDLEAVGVNVFIFGDVVLRWYDPSQIEPVRRG